VLAHQQHSKEAMLNQDSKTGIAVVVGAGTMGSGIAADLANAGWSVHILDVTAERAAAGIERIRQANPPLLFLPDFLERVRADHLDAAAEAFAAANWIVEAVAEDLNVKREVLAQIESAAPNAIVTSNTSGLGLAAMSQQCSPAFRRRFFGTHFLNPPRYLKLLEVIPTAETDTALLTGFIEFAETVLGHRVVLAKDTPGFISTRLWITHLLDTIHTAIEQKVDIETVDALTGPFVGRPRSATFRMADLVGLDIIAAVAKNQYALLPQDPLRERLRLPAIMETRIASGRLGEKSGGGFYRRDGKAILALDLTTGEYHPRRDVSPNLANPAQKTFLETILNRLFDYAHAVRPEIADSEAAVDKTMRWGFGWEKGPFAMAAERKGMLPPIEPFDPRYVTLAELPIVRTFETATLRDLGDGILCLELHAKMNTFSPAMNDAVLAAVEWAEAKASGLVIAGHGAHFSAGYDLSRLVAAMERGDLTVIDAEMRACQAAFLRVKYARVPVVAAVHGYTLGAGCEIALHSAAIVAAPELAMGLPETAVGVVPCGGGIKEMWYRLGDADATLQNIVRNRNSTSAHGARRAGRLRPTDTILANADRLLYTAKQKALALSAEYEPPRPLVMPSGTSLDASLTALQNSEDLTEHDLLLAAKVAEVIGTGGTEQAMLDAERHVFCELCQEPKSVERMRHLLATGKPLKN
jgi:3-hydroxyacyl-CoA dehydrogenase